jgi:hypothetical protein
MKISEYGTILSIDGLSFAPSEIRSNRLIFTRPFGQFLLKIGEHTLRISTTVNKSINDIYETGQVIIHVSRSSRYGSVSFFIRNRTGEEVPTIRGVVRQLVNEHQSSDVRELAYILEGPQ